jgi:hypothetical protein
MADRVELSDELDEHLDAGFGAVCDLENVEDGRDGPSSSVRKRP